MKKYNVPVLIFTLTLLFSYAVQAQDTLRFQLLNLDREPLSGAYFTYGDVHGISTDDGIIEVEQMDGVDMSCSFLGYGSWTLTPDDLAMASADGFLIRNIQEQSIQPVTVIALRPKISETKHQHLSDENKIAHDAGEILNLNAGIAGIRKSGSYGIDPVFRGFKYDQINIVMDGVQGASAACPNRMDPPTSQMSPNMVDRIEILKGPFALRYGGGIGATINFINDRAQFLNEGIHGRISGRYDSNGNAYSKEAMIGWNGQAVDLKLMGAFSTGGAYRDGGGLVIPSNYDRRSIGLQTAVKMDERNHIDFTGFYNWAKDVDFPSLRMDLRQDHTTMMNASHTLQLNDVGLNAWKTTVFYSHVDHLMDNLLKNLSPRTVNASTDAITKNLGGRTEGTWKWNHHKLHLGADYKVERAQGVRTRVMLVGPMAGKVLVDNAWQQSQNVKTGVFLEYTKWVNRWQFVLSSRLENSTATVDDPDPYFSEQYEDLTSNQYNPSSSMGALFNITEHVALGLWVARAQRSASISERYINRFPIGVDPYEIIGSPELSPEVNNQVEFTFQYRTRSLNLSVNTFASRMEDYILALIDDELTPLMMNSPGVRRFTNIEHVFKTGFEIGFNHKINNWLQQNIDVAYTYAQNVSNDEPLAEIAPLDFRYQLDFMDGKDKFVGNLSVRHVRSQDRVSSEFGEHPSPGFTVVHASLGYNLTHYARISGGVENIFDVQYAEHLSRSTLNSGDMLLNAPGRNFYLHLKYRF